MGDKSCQELTASPNGRDARLSELLDGLAGRELVYSSWRLPLPLLSRSRAIEQLVLNLSSVRLSLSLVFGAKVSRYLAYSG
jgi:hypothetical protein